MTNRNCIILNDFEGDSRIYCTRYKYCTSPKDECNIFIESRLLILFTYGTVYKFVYLKRQFVVSTKIGNNREVTIGMGMGQTLYLDI